MMNLERVRPQLIGLDEQSELCSKAFRGGEQHAGALAVTERERELGGRLERIRHHALRADATPDFQRLAQLAARLARFPSVTVSRSHGHERNRKHRLVV